MRRLDLRLCLPGAFLRALTVARLTAVKLAGALRMRQSSRNWGIEVLSLDCCSTARAPSPGFCAELRAETRCTAPLPGVRSKERRAVYAVDRDHALDGAREALRPGDEAVLKASASSVPKMRPS